MTIRRHISLIILALCALTAPAHAQLIFTPDSWDFGTISETDGRVSHTFTGENRSDKPVVILDVVTTCGCTVPEFTKRPIRPSAPAPSPKSWASTPPSGARSQRSPCAAPSLRAPKPPKSSIRSMRAAVCGLLRRSAPSPISARDSRSSLPSAASTRRTARSVWNCIPRSRAACSPPTIRANSPPARPPKSTSCTSTRRAHPATVRCATRWRCGPTAAATER
ncbi:DUF1573 domain-containing protein [Alistipes finegoldii]|uniref:DUF1573 domain-containing protein n=1 Tax=Alistipes finegoldii TaxID=214856 RepID=UPI00307926AD